MRIWSLLPSATEMLFALGLGEQVTGITHECDYPPEAKTKPRVTFSFIDSSLPSHEIDRQVSRRLHEGQQLYGIDEASLHEQPPDLIITQDLCPVCAVSPSDFAGHLESAGCEAALLCLNPHLLDDVLADIERVGQATGREREASELCVSLSLRIERVGEVLSTIDYRPRLLCLEWLDPTMPAGHWLPQMIEIAGGQSTFVEPGQPARKVAWQELLAYEPEVIVLMPCGMDALRAVAEAAPLLEVNGWLETPAIREGHVYSVDANSYFSRPGPRLIDGLEILARILHPDLFTKLAPSAAVLKLSIVPDIPSNWAASFAPYR